MAVHSAAHIYACIPARLSIWSIQIQAMYTIARAYNVIAGFPVPVCTRARTVTVHTDSGLGWTPNVLQRTFGVHPRRSSTYFVHCSSTVRPLFTRVSHSRKFPQIPGTFHTDMDEQWTWMNSGRTVDEQWMTSTVFWLVWKGYKLAGAGWDWLWLLAAVEL